MVTAVVSTCRDLLGGSECKMRKKSCQSDANMKHGCAATCGFCQEMEMSADGMCPVGYSKGIGETCQGQ